MTSQPNNLEYEHLRMMRAGAEEDRISMQQRKMYERIFARSRSIERTLYGPVGEYIATDPHNDSRVRKFLLEGEQNGRSQAVQKILDKSSTHPNWLANRWQT